eukprot:scaffold90394_cov24-Tisochrysis_lutea.AAC.3
MEAAVLTLVSHPLHGSRSGSPERHATIALVMWKTPSTDADSATSYTSSPTISPRLPQFSMPLEADRKSFELVMRRKPCLSSSHRHGEPLHQPLWTVQVSRGWARPGL